MFKIAEVFTMFTALSFLCCLGYCYHVTVAVDRQKGPVFLQEPPHNIDFSNTTGAVIQCLAHGNPSPTVSWSVNDRIAVSDVTGLRYVRSDGALVFPPFRGEDFRQEIHDATYRCIASNSVGTIGSREVKVKGVVLQSYVVEVYKTYAVRGNTAVLECHIPDFVRKYVTVTSWLKDGSVVIYPTFTEGRYTVFPSGKLYIRQVESSDNNNWYQCQTQHRLTQKIHTSATKGQLVVTEPTIMTPKIIDIRRRVVVKQGETAELPCAARGYPVPSYLWYKHDGVQLKPIKNGVRPFLVDGILRIRSVRTEDGGRYICLVNNSLGSEQAETYLTVIEPLSVEIHPRRQVIDIGKSASFNCSILGQPISNVEWRKDQQPLEGEKKRQLVSRNVVYISSVGRDDKGMYQCFVSSDWESVQSAGELSLEEDEPSLQEKFSGQTLQPGSSLTLRCVAQGGPLPQVTWSLDGISIPDSPRLRMGDYVTQYQRVISYVNISNIQPEDGGTYSCKAGSDVGEVIHSAKINVLGPPFVRPMKNVSVVAGEIMILHCPVGGYPIDSIVWEREGVRLPYNHRQKVYPNGTLVVKDIERVRPVIDPFSFPASVHQGQRFTAICTVIKGDSPVRFTWLKDKHRLEDYLDIRVVGVGEFSSTLIFNSLRPEHHGNYTCIASNLAGSVSHTAKMIIHVPPRWKVEPRDSFVIKGHSALIDCQVDGFPHPRIRWTKSAVDTPRDYRPISSSSRLYVYENGTMAIHNAQKEDAGFYLCQASNGISPSISKVIKLSIHVAAHFTTKFRAETVSRGYNAKLKCEARGDRPISVVWMKDKHLFHPQDASRYNIKKTLHSNGITSLLIIHDTDRRDSALFTCVASNPYGSDDTNIKLIIQEPPDTPQELKVKLVTSRSVKIEWASPYSGNSPIIEYTVQWKENKNRWQDSSIANISVHGSDSMTTINDLRPMTVYDFRVRAVNSLGTSGFSEPVRVKTDEESPGGPPINVQAEPTSSQSVKVSWKPPHPEVRFGELTGYYIGYKIAGASDSFVYKTLSLNDKATVEETHLTNLRRFTKYKVVVQAFNNKGAGPPSDEVFVQTFPNDPPVSPKLNVVGSSTSNIRLSWEGNTLSNDPVSGYLLYYKSNNEEWKERSLPGNNKKYTVEGLNCGSHYQLYLLAFNSAGKSEPSELISTKTEGMAPVAPEKQSLLVTNRTSVTVLLTSWHDGGCPIESFSVSYKVHTEDSWRTVSSSISGDQKQVTIPTLIPGTRYEVKITAQNKAGSTEAEYSFVTVSTSKMFSTPIPILIGEKVPFYLDLNIILPTGVSFVVVVVVMFLVSAIVRRRSSSESSISGSSVYNCRKMQTREAVQLSSLDNQNSIKKSSASPSRTKSFTYPQPYATTQLSGSEDKKLGDVDDYSLAKDEPLYATVKRTPRPPRSEVHLYDYESSAQRLYDESHPSTSYWKGSHAFIRIEEYPSEKSLAAPPKRVAAKNPGRSPYR
ncbi:Down syndrome cell adhesion molecule homolog [Limulus polyphemus]|uniref:Down syndrome cell adhesion molecule homolog n=1 Tax=Limulus polyphemus TaxID=6850 RepID=A0ABM1SFB9_LIMPO|nr:Down syndrome cell adhesion molecule homolog [Limulus polyphemus]